MRVSRIVIGRVILCADNQYWSIEYNISWSISRQGKISVILTLIARCTC